MSDESRPLACTIDGRRVSFAKGETLLAVAARAGIEIPTLCWDPRLEPVGACRLCLVEVEDVARLVPACATPASAGMVVHTEGGRVEHNRRFVLGLHLADVADLGDAADAATGTGGATGIEDRGGGGLASSRLGELAQRHGSVGSFPAVSSPRRGRPQDDNAFIGFRPELCIACSLCTRYCDGVEGVSAITLAERGAATTVMTADGRPLLDTTCELCGGCVAVCPTGAMVDRAALARDRPRAETARVRTTCGFCGVGCQLDLHVDREANRLVEITPPPPGTTVNDGNLCVKGRFAYEFVHHPDRLTTPLVRNGDGELVAAGWEEALDRAARGLLAVKSSHGADALGFVSSSRCTGEENYLVQKMARAAIGTHNVHQCAAT